MKHSLKNNQLIRTVPYRTPKKKTKVITSRFTDEEKAEIDNIVNKYGTTLTDFVRNAIFFYISILNQNKKENNLEEKITNLEDLNSGRIRLNNLKSAIENIEDQINKFEKKANLV